MRQLNKRVWPYQFKKRLKVDKYDDASRWCQENLPTTEWYGFMTPRTFDTVFAFKNELNLTLFSLKWS